VRGTALLPFRKELVLGALLALLSAVMWRFAPGFSKPSSLLGMTRYMAEVGLLALPMTAIIISGGIDLSSASIMGLCAVLLGVLWQGALLPVWAACTVAVAVGGLLGLSNGLVISRLGVPPLIATLATMAVFRGAALGISKANPVHGFPEGFFFIGQGQAAGLPFQVWILVPASVFAGLYLWRARGGRSVYAIGANEAAAAFSGIPVPRVKMLLYGASGLAGGLAAVVYVSRVSTAKADAGLDWELDVITAVVLGGASITGGTGRIAGTILALLIIQVLRTGMNLLALRSAWQLIAVGAILAASVLVDRLRLRGAAAG